MVLHLEVHYKIEYILYTCIKLIVGKMKKEQLIAFLESELNASIFSVKENDIEYLHGDIQLKYSRKNQLDSGLFRDYQYKKNVDENCYGIQLYFDNSRLKQFVEVINLYLDSRKEEILEIKVIEAQIDSLRIANFKIAYGSNTLVLKFTSSNCLLDILLN